MSAAHPLASLGSSSSPIRITLSDLDGTHVVDIRKYYLDKKTSELKPTQKGISVKEENFTELIAVLSENEAVILDWLRGSSASANPPGRQNVRQTTLSQPIRVTFTDDANARGAGFFACSHQGSEIQISFGASHPFSLALSNVDSGDSSANQLIAVLLASLEVARYMSSAGADKESGMVNYPALMMNWSVALKHLLKSQDK